MMETISAGAELAFTVADKLGAPFLARGRRRALVRLVYFEACANLERFAILREGALADMDSGDPALRWLVDSLRTDAMRAVLLGDADSFRALDEAHGGFDSLDEEGDRDYRPANLHQALKYLVVKSEFLRWALSAPESASLAEPKFGLRLSRLRATFVAVISCLREAPELRRFSKR